MNSPSSQKRGNKWKMKVAPNEKQKKLPGFSFSINIQILKHFSWGLRWPKTFYFWRVTKTKIKVLNRVLASKCANVVMKEQQHK